MKKCWFLALVAVGLIGCSEASDNNCDEGKVMCNGSCVDACTTGTLNMTTCVCEGGAAQTCEEQGKVTCNNTCYEKCEGDAARDPANACACPGKPAPTCEEQGKVTCKDACVDACTTGKILNTETCECEGGDAQTCEDQGKVTCKDACVDACATGKTLNTETCECEGGSEQTCEEQGKVTCNGSCYDKCADDGVRDENNNCVCPGQTEVTCEEQGKVTCNGSCYEKCADDGVRDENNNCVCPGQTEVTCEEQGKVTCKDACVDACATGKTLNPETCECEGGPVDTKCTKNEECTSAGTPICNTNTGKCVADTCGNGVVIAPEICDPTAEDTYKNRTCADFDGNKTWEDGGKPGCNELCKLSQGTCVEKGTEIPSSCGDGKLDKSKGELCESDDDIPKNETCQKYNQNTYWTSDSKVTCNTNTCQYDYSTCVEDLCGNGLLDAGEECDFGRNSNKVLVEEDDCVKVDKKYTSGKAQCTNSCKNLNVTKCQEDTSNKGIYKCQILEPTSVVYDDEKTTEKMSIEYAIGSDVTEANMQAELVWGVNFNDKDNWQKAAATQDASNDKFSQNLTKQNVEHYVDDDVVYYTFRVRANSDAAWTYCTKSGIDFGKINKNTVGVASVSKVVASDILAKFDFNDTNKWKGKDPRNAGNGFAADEGTGTLIMGPASSTTNCNNNNCFSNGVTGQCFGINGCKTAISGQDGAIDNNGVAVGNHLLISGVNASGVSGINLDMQVKRNNDGNSPKNLVIRYSTNGTDYTNVKTIDLVTGDTEFHAMTTIELPSAVNNCSALNIQVIPYGGNGIIKFDDIVISKSGN